MIDSILAFFSKVIALIQFPPPRLTHKHVEKVLSIARPGDIILCKAHGSFASLFIPGEWDHVGCFVSNTRCIEATTHGVVLSYVEDIIVKKNDISIWRAKKEWSLNALMCTYPQFVGMPYDFKFRLGNKAIYCSELIVRLFKICGKLLRFRKSNIFGREYYEPSTFLEPADWECLYDTTEDDGYTEQEVVAEVCVQA